MSPFLASAVRVWAVALTTVREAVRSRVLAVLALFAVGLMAFSVVLGELSMHEEVRVIKDLGLAGISLVNIVIALFLGVNLLAKELERKTVYAIVPKPIFRWEFLLGKYAGLLLTMTSLVVAMAATLWVFVAANGGHHGVAMIRAEILLLCEIGLLVAVALLFSSFSSPYLSAMLTAGVWIIGRNTPELEALAETRLAGRPAGMAIELVVLGFPDFHQFYVSGADLEDGGTVSIHDVFVGWAYVGDAAFYAAAYAALCLLVAAILFARRDFT